MSSNQPQRTSKFLQWINYRVRVQLHDSSKDRYLVGTLISYDKHMNLVLVDTEEYRIIKNKKPKQGEEAKNEQNGAVPETTEVKRALGFVLLRGDSIVSMSAEAPPS